MFGRDKRDFDSRGLRERPTEQTLDMPGVNGNPAGAIIRGSPTPLSQDTREAAIERRPLAAKAARYKADAGIAEQFDAPDTHEAGRALTALDQLDHAGRNGSNLPATIGVREVGSLVRAVLADLNIAPTAIQGISDRLQTTELVLARDMTDQRDAIDDQHDRLVRMERDFARLAETIKLAKAQTATAESQLDLIRELLGCKEGDDVVAAVRKRLRWERELKISADTADLLAKSREEAVRAGAINAEPSPEVAATS